MFPSSKKVQPFHNHFFCTGTIYSDRFDRYVSFSMVRLCDSGSRSCHSCSESSDHSEMSGWVYHECKLIGTDLEIEITRGTLGANSFSICEIQILGFRS